MGIKDRLLYLMHNKKLAGSLFLTLYWNKHILIIIIIIENSLYVVWITCSCELINQYTIKLTLLRTHSQKPKAILVHYLIKKVYILLLVNDRLRPYLVFLMRDDKYKLVPIDVLKMKKIFWCLFACLNRASILLCLFHKLVPKRRPYLIEVEFLTTALKVHFRVLPTINRNFLYLRFGTLVWSLIFKIWTLL